jgi:hypothetical protein
MNEYFGSGSIWACVKIVDYYDPSSIGTQTHVKLIEYICECVLPPTMRSLQ